MDLGEKSLLLKGAAEIVFKYNQRQKRDIIDSMKETKYRLQVNKIYKILGKILFK